MDELLDYAGELALGFLILILRLFGKKDRAAKLTLKLKKLRKKAKKHAKQLEKDCSQIEEIEKEV